MSEDPPGETDRRQRPEALASTDGQRESKGAARGAILARRARFVAAALTSAGLAGAGYACTCLSVVRQPDEPPAVDTEPSSGDAETSSVPSAPEDGVDAGQSERDEPGPQDSGAPEPPRPCLQPPRPRICLSDDPIEGELIDPTPEVCLKAPSCGRKP